jgi:hypothetical protein
MKLGMIAVAAGALALAGGPALAQSGTANCDRACVGGLVDQLLASMVAHNPDGLPLASVYTATENSHPASLGMMTAWRTITKAGKPSLLAIDAARGQSYFALPVEEAGSRTALWGRIKVVDRKITEVELFLSRSRGDHGFSFSVDQMPDNYRLLMNPPAARARASHDDLVKLSHAAFDASDPLKVAMAENCQFTEVGSKVIDPGLDDVTGPPRPAGQTAESPLGCAFPPFRPTDKNARVIAIDDELGIVVVAAVVPGIVYPYPFHGHMMSAFIPSDMKPPMQLQDAWIQRHLAQHKAAISKPEPSTGEVMQVLQLYDGKVQAEQINVYLSGPGMSSVWTQP